MNQVPNNKIKTNTIGKRDYTAKYRVEKQSLKLKSLYIQFWYK